MQFLGLRIDAARSKVAICRRNWKLIFSVRIYEIFVNIEEADHDEELFLRTALLTTRTFFLLFIKVLGIMVV